MANINRVVLVGNLTRDPELRQTPSGMAVCSLRIAVNTRRKDNSTGQWTEKPNYFDITVWGAQGENCAQYLAKGRPVGIDGRLDTRVEGYVRKVNGIGAIARNRRRDGWIARPQGHPAVGPPRQAGERRAPGTAAHHTDMTDARHGAALTG